MEKEECTELKNIQYQTMLLSGNKTVTTNYDEVTSTRIDSFLQKEKEINKNESWNKLDRAVKYNKFIDFSNKYIEDNITTLSANDLLLFLKGCLDKKRLMSNKEVLYCKDEYKILSIPALKYKNNRFGLERCDKRVSTLKSLTPIKTSSIKKKKEDVKSKN